jgi:hypothetical protein
MEDILNTLCKYEGYASIVHLFNSSTVSLLSKIIPNVGSNNPFILFINLIAMSMFGQVTMYICEF